MYNSLYETILKYVSKESFHLSIMDTPSTKTRLILLDVFVPLSRSVAHLLNCKLKDAAEFGQVVFYYKEEGGSLLNEGGTLKSEQFSTKKSQNTT